MGREKLGKKVLDTNASHDETEYIEYGAEGIPLGSLLNNTYSVIEIVGQGGMGRVYKAKNIRLKNTIVAIKEMNTEGLSQDEIARAIRNFENEASFLITLRHKSLPRILDFFKQYDKCYIVMDYIEGETLEDILQKRGAIDENTVREWLNQLYDVLHYLHSREPKVIFRDLKLSNIILNEDNEIKLIDFGIARHFNPNKSDDTTCYISNGFSPPEQYGFGQCDVRTDIYSLAVILYCLLVGKKVTVNNFKFTELNEIIDVSKELNDAIMKALDYLPDNRPSSIEEFMSICEINKEQSKNDFSEDSDKVKVSNKKKVVIIGVTIILIIGMILSISKIINTSTKGENDSNSSVNTLSDNNNNYTDNTVKSEDESNTVAEETTIKYGSYVNFGSFLGNESDPLTWRVLASLEEENALLLITDKVINMLEFGDNSRWDDSSLRKWLNGEFYSWFNKDQKHSIVSQNINTVFSGLADKYYTDKGLIKSLIKSTDTIVSPVNDSNYVEYTTYDNVFILSKDEYETFLNNKILDYGIGVSIASKPGEKAIIPYWLRSIDFEDHMQQNITSNYVPCLGVKKEDYNTEDPQAYIGVSDVKKEMGVRPSLMIIDFKIKSGDGTEENPYILEHISK